MGCLKYVKFLHEDLLILSESTISVGINLESLTTNFICFYKTNQHYYFTPMVIELITVCQSNFILISVLCMKFLLHGHKL